MQRNYPLDQSPLYRLSTKRRLALVIQEDIKELFKLTDSDHHYRTFELEDGRTVEHPIGHLEKIHRRFFQLIQRIEVPDYLHSGVKGRSYITNALEHLDQRKTIKLDIKKFYRSTDRSSVKRFLARELKCAPDVSEIMSRLLTTKDHLPTGSPASQLLAFHVHKPLFDAINDIAEEHSLKMTCYVDDLTLSGELANRLILRRIKNLIARHGLESHKERHYNTNDVRVITGVIIADGEVRLPNRRHLKIYELLQHHNQESGFDFQANVKNLERLVGQLNAAVELESKFTPLAQRYRQALSRLQREGRRHRW